jgi:copper chaperone CopZ
MKNIKLLTVIFLLSFFLVTVSYQNAIAECLAVRLTVPAIVSLETANEAASILKSIGGVIKVRASYKAHTAELFFHDEKISVKKIKTTLKKAGFPAKGKIKYIKISTFLT